jgi:REP element-mobilizing transposase RayT
MRQCDRDVEPSKPPPLAFFLTWTTYGTWLPGDERGWVERGRGQRSPDAELRQSAVRLLSEDPCTLTLSQRETVEQTIRDHCQVRGWRLWAVNCRSNHVHVVASGDRAPEEIMRRFKAWATRRLRELEIAHGELQRRNWWTERGSRRWINDEAGLEAAIHYVLNAQ